MTISTTPEPTPLVFVESGAFLVISILLLTAPGAVTLYLHGHAAFAIVLVLIMIAVTVPFSSIRVLVREGRLRVVLGGIITVRNVALTEIVAVRRFRPPVFAGLGLRWLRQGTLYTVTLGDAVEFELRDGTRFFVGSEAPDTMCLRLSSLINNYRGADGANAN